VCDLVQNSIEYLWIGFGSDFANFLNEPLELLWIVW
jgi:hypothetical protein